MEITDANLDPVAVNDPHPDAHNEERKAILDILEFLENCDGGGAPIEPPIWFEIGDEDVLLAEPSTSLNSIYVYGEGYLILPETGVPGERYRFLVENPQDLNIFTNNGYLEYDEDLEEHVWVEGEPGRSPVWVNGAHTGYVSAADVVYFLNEVEVNPDDPEPSVSGYWLWTWMKVDDGGPGGALRPMGPVAKVVILSGYAPTEELVEYYDGDDSYWGMGWGPVPGSYFGIELHFYLDKAIVRIENVQSNMVVDGYPDTHIIDQSAWYSALVNDDDVVAFLSGGVGSHRYNHSRQSIPVYNVTTDSHEHAFGWLDATTGVGVALPDDPVVLGDEYVRHGINEYPGPLTIVSYYDEYSIPG